MRHVLFYPAGNVISSSHGALVEAAAAAKSAQGYVVAGASALPSGTMPSRFMVPRTTWR